MSVYYYLIKPNKKETYCLGKYISFFSGVASSLSTASFIDYECFHDFFVDVMDNNVQNFMTDTAEEIYNILYEIYEWCDDKVYLTTDWDNDTSWHDYKETGSVFDFSEKHPSIVSTVLDIIDKYAEPEDIVKTEDDTVEASRTLLNIIDRLNNDGKANV